MVFNMFDGDKDGHVTPEELEAVLRNLGFRVGPHEAGIILREADKDENGTIELDEFINLMARLVKTTKEEEAEEKKKEKQAAKEKQKQTKKQKTSHSPAKSAKDKGKAKKKEEEEEEEEKPQAPKAQAPPSRRLKRADSQLKLAKGPSGPVSLTRGLSISDFYTNYAGMHDQIHAAPRDSFSNPQGREYDLGHEGAFGQFSVLVGLFCPDQLSEETFMKDAGKALGEKGFRVYVTTSEEGFAKNLPANDIGFVISTRTVSEHTPAVAEACWRHHQSGRGLAVWAENAPYFATANEVLKKLSPGTVITGYDSGGKSLSVGDANKRQQFGRHLLTSGITNLFEGITISYPESIGENLKILATSSDNHPCMLCADYPDIKDHEGRIVVDCGFTKLFCHWDTAGTARYVRNVCVWLLGLEHRLKLGMPLQGPMKLDTDGGSSSSSSSSSSATSKAE
ncbi:Caltractin [Balamuthia mandrillaris]